MMDVVKDDDHLNELTEKWEEQKFPALQIEDGNWFELFSNYKDEKPNFEEVLEESKFTLAIEEAIEVIVEFKEQ